MAQSAKAEILEKLLEIAHRAGASESIEIVEVELLGGGNNRVLRIFIDRPEGVTHSDCERISEAVGVILDAEDILPGHYTLEVSSPGIERKLKTLRDFERFTGKKAKVLLREPVEARRNWEGVLRGAVNGTIVLEAGPGHRIEFALEQVERANLKFDW